MLVSALYSRRLAATLISEDVGGEPASADAGHRTSEKPKVLLLFVFRKLLMPREHLSPTIINLVSEEWFLKRPPRSVMASQMLRCYFTAFIAD